VEVSFCWFVELAPVEQEQGGADGSAAIAAACAAAKEASERKATFVILLG
jgi:hypothetical protein